MAGIDLLVIGGSGFVGARLTEAAAHAGGKIAYTYFRHDPGLTGTALKVDVRDPHALESCIAEDRPGTIIYCSKPSVESDEREHHAVSVEGVERVLRVREPSRSKLIYLSTNAVFTGKQGRYREADPPDSGAKRDSYRSYAIAKAHGEQVVLSAGPNAVVVRTADVNGRDVQGMLNSRLAYLVGELSAGREITRLSRCYISPTLVDDLVNGLLEVSHPSFTHEGVLHLAGPERVSYYEFTRLVAQHIGADEGLVKPDIAHEQDLSLDTTYSRGIVKTAFRGVRDQLSAIFPADRPS